jgi:hypothetical protein
VFSGIPMTCWAGGSNNVALDDFVDDGIIDLLKECLSTHMYSHQHIQPVDVGPRESPNPSIAQHVTWVALNGV